LIFIVFQIATVPEMGNFQRGQAPFEPFFFLFMFKKHKKREKIISVKAMKEV